MHKSFDHSQLLTSDLTTTELRSIATAVVGGGGGVANTAAENAAEM